MSESDRGRVIIGWIYELHVVVHSDLYSYSVGWPSALWKQCVCWNQINDVTLWKGEKSYGCQRVVDENPNILMYNHGVAMTDTEGNFTRAIWIIVLFFYKFHFIFLWFFLFFFWILFQWLNQILVVKKNFKKQIQILTHILKTIYYIFRV